MKRTVFATALVFASFSSAPAATPESVPSPSGHVPGDPTTIYMGVLFQHIHDIDLKRGTANLDFYIWTRWKGDVDGTAFELMNGVLESKGHEDKREVDGVKYSYYRCRANAKGRFDFRSFPLDRHELVLEFEHSEHEDAVVVWAPDLDSLRGLEAPSLPGWVVEKPRFEVTRSVYRTNWGAPDETGKTQTSYSRFRVVIPLRHAGTATFAKTFLPLFISVCIAFLAFLIHPSHFDGKIGVGVAGVFGVVTSQLVVSGNLPEVQYLTLSDLIHTAGLLCVFLSLFVACGSAYLFRNDKERKAMLLDRITGSAMTVAYVATVVGMTLSRG